ncbi:MAG: major facilitator superfamily transporter [Acidobacteriaceae bacterium]|nr:major facilitator superfamily transporter [Acidobacteriaceae bacterium]
MQIEVVDNQDIKTVTPDNPGWQFAVASGILGWVLDAFDFFVVVFLVDTLANNFHVGKKEIVFTITLTLAMRPLGALIFGSLADRFGRKIPLMVCVLYFSIVTALSAFVPTFSLFVLMRALYGIGMGGYWGIGASLAMESAPRRWRGLLSGMMQGGYPLGYLLAAVAMKAVLPRFGWQALFLCGFGVAVLIAVLITRAPESKAWHEHRMPTVGAIFRTLFQHKKSFAYLLLVMSVMTCLSHGTQDLYPDFLKSIHNFTRNTVSNIAILYNIGAITGAVLFGHLSERIGRRRSIMLALTLSLLAIPAWAFGSTVVMLTVASIIMQTGVQGAFGVIPAHLNELSPDAVRSLFPGFVYQLGVLVGSPAVIIEYTLRDHFGYQWALASFEGCVIISLMFIYGFGPERRGRSFRTND